MFERQAVIVAALSSRPMFATLAPPRLHARHRWLSTPVVLFGVLALHAGLLLVATRLGVWPDRVSARGPLPVAASPLMLWLLDRTAPQPAADPAAQPAAARRNRRDAVNPSPASLPPAATRDPQAITLPAPSSENPPQTPSEAPQRAEPSPPQSAAPAALNLSLPRAASAPWRTPNPVLDDARANTRAPVNMTTLIARALGGDPYGPISEEHLADGSVRLRRGSQCVVARPNQAQNIDPYNGSVLPKPRLLDKC